MCDSSLKKTTVNSLIWKLCDKFGTQIISFIVQIILARLLLPSDYGIIAVVTIFISIGNVFVHSGFNIALVQKKNSDDLDFSSAFYLCLFISVIVYIILFFLSPFIEQFYNYDNLSFVLRVLSLSLIFNSISTIQVAYVTKNFLFKKNFLCNIASAIISGVIAIILAYQNFEIWALVFYQLLNVILNSLFLFVFVKWRPKLLFSFNRVKCLFSYGIKLLFSSLINIIFKNIYGLVIGKIYTQTDLGLYNKGNQFPSLLADNIDGSISTVLFPILAKEQDNRARMKAIMKRMIKINSFITIPILIGLIAVAEPLVRILLTEKWLECVPFLELLSLTYVLYPIHTTNLQAISAIGRSDFFLKLEIIKKVMVVISLVITMHYSIYAMIISQIILSIISTFINATYSKKEFNYGILEQWRDIGKTLAISFIMFCLTRSLGLLIQNCYLLLLLQIMLGIIVYIILSYIFNKEIFMYLLEILLNYKNVLFSKIKRKKEL